MSGFEEAGAGEMRQAARIVPVGLVVANDFSA
jgi:hypothetical protein